MRKRNLNLLVILITFLIICKSNGQTNYETIYLKNGSIIKGNIVEFVPNATYTILTPDGNKFVFNICE